MRCFIESFSDFDNQISMEVTTSWNVGNCKVNDLEFSFTRETIMQGIQMLNEREEIQREGMIDKLVARNKFQQSLITVQVLIPYKRHQNNGSPSTMR